MNRLTTLASGILLTGLLAASAVAAEPAAAPQAPGKDKRVIQPSAAPVPAAQKESMKKRDQAKKQRDQKLKQRTATIEAADRSGGGITDLRQQRK